MEPNNIFDIFFSLENPAIYAMLFITILLAMVFLIKQEFISPLKVREQKLELENSKLNALYSEVDPNPIIRTDQKWKVIDMNNSAKEIFNKENTLLRDLVSDIHNNNDKKKNNFVIEIKSKYYSVVVKNVNELNFNHIYLHDISNRIKYENKIKTYQEDLKKLRNKLDNANEEEKQYAGKELHDGIGHSLSLLKIEMENFFENKGFTNTEIEVSGILHSIDKLSDEVKELSHTLRPRILTEFGLIQAIKSLVDKINSYGKMKGYVTYNKEFRIDEKILERNIFRICQEALNNIIKHSNCLEFHIDFHLKKKVLRIAISDDGSGFNLIEQYSVKGSSLGLLNMKERTESVGGTFNIDSMLSMGTIISLKFNIQKAEDD